MALKVSINTKMCYDFVLSLTVPESFRLVRFPAFVHSRLKKGKSRVVKDRMQHDRMDAARRERSIGDSDRKPEWGKEGGSRWRNEDTHQLFVPCIMLEILGRES